jgi:hypothetical protein
VLETVQCFPGFWGDGWGEGTHNMGRSACSFLPSRAESDTIREELSFVILHYWVGAGKGRKLGCAGCASWYEGFGSLRAAASYYTSLYRVKGPPAVSCSWEHHIMSPHHRDLALPLSVYLPKKKLASSAVLGGCSNHNLEQMNEKLAQKVVPCSLERSASCSCR